MLKLKEILRDPDKSLNSVVCLGSIYGISRLARSKLDENKYQVKAAKANEDIGKLGQ